MFCCHQIVWLAPAAVVTSHLHLLQLFLEVVFRTQVWDTPWHFDLSACVFLPLRLSARPNLDNPSLIKSWSTSPIASYLLYKDLSEPAVYHNTHLLYLRADSVVNHVNVSCFGFLCFYCFSFVPIQNSSFEYHITLHSFATLLCNELNLNWICSGLQWHNPLFCYPSMCSSVHPSFHHSIFCHLSWAGTWCLQATRGSPDIPLPRSAVQLLLGDPEPDELCSGVFYQLNVPRKPPKEDT